MSFDLQWTAPTMQHAMRVIPLQGTAATPRELEEFTVRAFSHWLIDHLPPKALSELVASLVGMFDFYRNEQMHAHALPSETKKFGRVLRTTRPEVVLPDEE
jgi:hypothetical protein